MKKIHAMFAAGLVAVLGATTASASVCQVQSSSFYVRQYCGLTSRGYGEGTTAFGQKALIAQNGGSGAYSVGAVGVNSSGQTLNNCKPVDTVADGNPTYAVGGDCAKAVKFWVQIGYY